VCCCAVEYSLILDSMLRDIGYTVKDLFALLLLLLLLLLLHSYSSAAAAAHEQCSPLRVTQRKRAALRMYYSILTHAYTHVHTHLYTHIHYY
jgi:hypothetical protein